MNRFFKIHVLKCWPDFFSDVQDGSKTFEFRKDDRDFQIGDLLDLHEFDPETQKKSGRSQLVLVTYVCREPPLPNGFCIMGIEREKQERKVSVMSHESAERIAFLIDESREERRPVVMQAGDHSFMDLRYALREQSTSSSIEYVTSNSGKRLLVYEMFVTHIQDENDPRCREIDWSVILLPPPGQSLEI